MPGQGWNGKFLGVGNGGWAGNISYPAMAEALGRGYAVASTDTGHSGNGGDASFALGHPEKLIDFGYRAVHEMTAAAKAFVSAFYDAAPRFSYWNGCSTGGKQGLTEAQRFPADYDGIIAGAPANNWTRLMTGLLWAGRATLSDPASRIPAEKFAILNRAALNACDARGWCGGRRHRESAQLPFRSTGGDVQGRRRRRLSDGGAGRGRKEDLRTGNESAHGRSALPRPAARQRANGVARHLGEFRALLILRER